MIDQNYEDADSGARGDVVRLSMLSLVMIAAGIFLWTWSDRLDGASVTPPLILAGSDK